MAGPTYMLFGAPTAQEWIACLLMFAALVALIGVAEFLRFLLKWPAEVTRKLVHVCVGLVVSFAPVYCSSGIPLLVLGGVFLVSNLVTLKLGILKGMQDASRRSFGTVYYPLAFLILVVLLWEHEAAIISLAMLVLAFGDAAAAIVGETHASPHVFRLSSDKKSIEGSVTMFMVSVSTLGVGLAQFGELAGLTAYEALAIAVVAALTATAWEALSSRGLDNLTVPLSVAFILWFYTSASGYHVEQFTLGTGLALAIAAASFALRLLSASGSVATFLLAGLIFGIGGWRWTVPMLTFFVLSSILSRAGKGRKSTLEDVFEKSGRRDYAQVAANGGVGGILVGLSFLIPEFNWYPLYLGSLAAVTADTWSTELGVLRRREPMLVTTLERVPPGTSGAVSFLGTAAGIIGASVIALSAVAWMKDLRLVPVVIVAGLVGSVVDSVLGATCQGRYRCTQCGRTTERRTHCDTTTELVGGFRWMNNDAVNWVCALTGAAVVWLIW